MKKSDYQLLVGRIKYGDSLRSLRGDLISVDANIALNKVIKNDLIDIRLRTVGAICCPVPSQENREQKPISHVCPNAKVIWKFCKATGKKERIIINCGHCSYCKHKRQNELIFRIFQHGKSFEHRLFVTLTYNDAHYPISNEHSKEDLLDDSQRFYKRLRKRFGDIRFNYYHVAEKGKLTGRLHHHFILFWSGISVEAVKEYIQESWQDIPRTFYSFGDFVSQEAYNEHSPIGFTYFGEVTNKSIAYVTKYMNKGSNELTVFQTWSKGLGKGIINIDYWKKRLRFQSIIDYKPDPKGKRYYIPVPRYYKNLVFRQDERDALFRQYINSAELKERIRFVLSPNFMDMNNQDYERYCEKCAEREHARDVERIKRNTDL